MIVKFTVLEPKQLGRIQGSHSTSPYPAHQIQHGAGRYVCNTDAMTLHLVEVDRTVAPGAHAVLLVHQSGWDVTAALIIPQNISIIPLSAKCPELNPVENIWQFMRDNWLSNRIFES
ncbi:hypothetical protein P775_22210 [Puniceibacterium antarcticum]|uniref:Tc1-like transposase DDE domain-containing protein n=1 Tax=Puniceibacterium antarcticum TaxID=1206336 RepID=A0A2G8R8R5_9RHOB|nr:hypothetical protein P775_22210 [Puniceibacterium antarcticum]